MDVADITVPFVAKEFEWLIVAPLITTVGLNVVEISASLKALVKQTNSVEVEVTGMQFVF
jgi:hypothetical protein